MRRRQIFQEEGVRSLAPKTTGAGEGNGRPDTGGAGPPGDPPPGVA